MQAYSRIHERVETCSNIKYTHLLSVVVVGTRGPTRPHTEKTGLVDRSPKIVGRIYREKKTENAARLSLIRCYKQCTAGLQPPTSLPRRSRPLPRQYSSTRAVPVSQSSVPCMNRSVTSAFDMFACMRGYLSKPFRSLRCSKHIITLMCMSRKDPQE